MFRHSLERRLALTLVVSIALLAGCTSSPTVPSSTNYTTQPTTVPTRVPTTQPNTLPSISPSATQPFQIEVQPQQLKGFSLPGQRIVVLVTIANDSQVDSNIVEISAEAKDASVSIEHKTITNSQVAEVNGW